MAIQVRIWDADAGVELGSMPSLEPGNAVYCLDWGGELVAAGCRQRGVRLFDIRGGREALVRVLAGHVKEITSLSRAVGPLIASGSADCTVKIWDARCGEVRRDSGCCFTLRGHGSTVMGVAFDGAHQVVSGSNDKTVRLWDLRQNGRCLRTLEAHSSAVFAVQADQSRIITGSADQTCRIFSFAAA